MSTASIRPTFSHGLVTIFLSGAAFFLLTFLARYSFIRELASWPTDTFLAKAELFVQAWLWSLQDMSRFQMGINIAVAVLFGINAVSIFYLVRMYKAAYVSLTSLLGMGGFASALAGLWCLSCGSLLLAFLPSLISFSSLSVLPFQGSEFGLVSVILLSVSLGLNCKKLLSLNAGSTGII